MIKFNDVYFFYWITYFHFIDVCFINIHLKKKWNWLIEFSSVVIFNVSALIYIDKRFLSNIQASNIFVNSILIKKYLVEKFNLNFAWIIYDMQLHFAYFVVVFMIQYVYSTEVSLRNV